MNTISGQERKALEDEREVSGSLKSIKRWAEEIAGEWNGDNPGRQEDRAHQATDILEKVKELEDLITNMQEL